MINIKIFLLGFLLKKLFRYILVLFPLALSAQINRNGDFQIWCWNFAAKQFSPEWMLLSLFEFRVGDEASKFYRASFSIEPIYTPVKWLGLAPGYRQVGLRFPINSNHWKPEYTPFADVFFFLFPSKWQLIDRNRVEYRILDSDPVHWVYRNRIRIVPPRTFTSFQINPYLENEIFIRQRRGLNEDRLTVGLMSHIYKNLSGELSYMARFQKQHLSRDWIHQNILNIVFFLAF